ncbi:MAG: sulfite exporter TauE/SafE family protein, partial [Nitrososphaerales archaeon]
MMEIPYPVLLAGIFVLGGLSGGLSNVTSGGAGVFTIYFMTNYAGLAIQDSTGTVLAASTVIVLIGAFSFYRMKQVNMRLAITVGLSGVAGAFLVARWASTIGGSSLEQAFGGFTLALACYTSYIFINEWRKQKAQNTLAPDVTSVITNTNRRGIGSKTLLPQYDIQSPGISSGWSGTSAAALTVQIAIGLLVGVATGIFGVGLASLSILLFILLFKLDVRVALGTSLLASFCRYAGGSIGYLTASQFDLLMFGILVFGGGIGSIVGSKMMIGNRNRSRDIYVKLLQVALLIFISYEFL